MYVQPQSSMTYAAPQSAMVYGAPAPVSMPVVYGAAQPVMKRRQIRQIGMTKQRSLFGGPPPVGQVHMLVIALDYKGTGNELTCTMDGNNMQALAKAAGVQDVTVLYDYQCTKDAVFQAIQQVTSRCAPGDTFLFNYSGHGTSITDYDGDEVDSNDEAFVLVDAAGQISENSCLTDDEFCNMVTQCTNPSVTVVVIADCCHSGTICDFKKPQWTGRRAFSISGCRDTETSGDVGRGGICTHALLLAVEDMQKKGKNSYTCGDVFRETLRIDDSVFNSAQNITSNWTQGTTPKDYPFPLVPRVQYTAPYQQGGAPSSKPTYQPAYAQPQQAYAQPQLAYAQPQPAYAQPQPQQACVQQISCAAASPYAAQYQPVGGAKLSASYGSSAGAYVAVGGCGYSGYPAGMAAPIYSYN